MSKKRKERKNENENAKMETRLKAATHRRLPAPLLSNLQKSMKLPSQCTKRPKKRV